MQVIGFQFDKIFSERKSREIINNLKVNSTMNIKDIREEKVDVMIQVVLKIDFEFSTTYDENYAVLLFAGSVLVMVEKNEGKDILKLWKEKVVDPKVQVPLYNLILIKCNIRSLQLEDELGLPLHIQLPRIGMQSGDQKSSYTG